MLEGPLYQIEDSFPSEMELASKFGVSRPTVHKAIRKLQEEGYLQSRARVGSVVIKKPQEKQASFTFGLILPFLNKKGLFPHLAQSIAEKSSLYNFNIIWGGQFQSIALNADQLNHMADFYIQQNVDGVFFSPVELSPSCKETNNQIVDKLQKHHIPIVLVDSNYVEYPNNNELDVVRIDNHRAGFALAEHFIAKGCDRIDFCMLPYTGETVKMRLRGVWGALVSHGFSPTNNWVHTLDTNHDLFLQDIISSQAKNLICSNDALAIKIIEILTDAGYRIPGDYRVAGFDNSENSKLVIPSLTTIDQPSDTLAELAIKTMIERIKSPQAPIREVLSNFKLIERSSTK
jgi:DNA-binding LacI/PurR family transcriptional regulator